MVLPVFYKFPVHQSVDQRVISVDPSKKFALGGVDVSGIELIGPHPGPDEPIRLIRRHNSGSLDHFPGKLLTSTKWRNTGSDSWMFCRSNLV